jgi:DNA (cytosine-5)-methyltransferase 1
MINTDLMKLSKDDLLLKCKELNIDKCKSKNKTQLIKLIEESSINKKKNEQEHEIINNSNEIINNINENITIENNKLKFIDLFCGIGGFHQALTNLNGKCVFSCDIDKKCRKVYEKNYGLTPHDDIINVDEKKIPNFDILCAGFPCQAFSNAGKKNSFNDKRGTLFEHILRIAVEKKPSFIFLENVKHIKKIENGKVFNHIIKRINESGYYVNNETIFELSPHQLGVPQHRERVIFVCIRKDLYDSSKKIEIIPPDIDINIDNIIEKNVVNIDKYKISNEIENVLNAWDEIIKEMNTGETLSPTILCNEFNNNYSDDKFNSLPDWKQEYITKNKPLYKKYKDKWDKWYEKHKNLLLKKEIYGKLEWQVGKKKENDSIWNYFIQLRQSGIRVKKSDYFPTLVAIVQTPIYAKERRYITPRECARLQSFSDNFIIDENDHDAYKQFGNAVNVKVVQYVIEKTLKIYNLI